MVRTGFYPISILTASSVLAAAMAFSGCGHSHPDDRMAVYGSLDKNDLRSVNVSQDRNAGTMTLSGIVGSNVDKQKAIQSAQQAAPGYSIVDRIQVENSGLQSAVKAAQRDVRIDNAIESHYKATLKAHRDLSNVHYSAYNQTLTLKGTVKTYKEREEAEDLAKKVPQVEKVVNEIQLEKSKTSPANS